MQKPLPQPLHDTVVEPDEAIFREILNSISHLSEQDCERIVALQKYHEWMYLYGSGIPKYQFVRGIVPKMNA